MPDIERIASTLWEARYQRREVVPVRLTDEEVREVLGRLISRALREGDEVIGWKVGFADPRQRAELEVIWPFIGPVLRSSVEAIAMHKMFAPRVEVEFVGRLRVNDKSISSDRDGWHVGLEFVDNHAADWAIHVPFSIADWGLHAAAAVGDRCARPSAESPVVVRLTHTADGGSVDRRAAKEGHRLVGTLAGAQEYRSRVLPDLDWGPIFEERTTGWPRGPRDGDLIWTGSLVGEFRLTQPGCVVGEVLGCGRVSCDVAF